MLLLVSLRKENISELIYKRAEINPLLTFILFLYIVVTWGKSLIFTVCFIPAHNAVVTVAIFAPHPELIIRPQFEFIDSDDKIAAPPDVRGEVLVSADFGGSMKIFINKFKPGSG